MNKLYKFKEFEFKTLLEVKKQLVKGAFADYGVYEILPDTGEIKLLKMKVLKHLTVCKWCDRIIYTSKKVYREPGAPFPPSPPPDRTVTFVDPGHCDNPRCKEYAKYRKEFFEENGELYCSLCLECGKHVTIHKGNDKPLCSTHGGIALDKPTIKSFEQWCPLTRITSNKVFRGLQFLNDIPQWLVYDRLNETTPEVYLLEIMHHWDYPRFLNEEMTNEEKNIADKFKKSALSKI